MGDLIGVTPDDSDIPSIAASDLNLAELALVWKNSRFYKLSLAEMFLAATRVPKGYVSERITVYNDSGDLEHDIGINPALAPCRDDTDAFTFQPLSVIVKQIDSGFSEGTNAGGMDTGSVAPNSVYYLWYIYKPSTNHIDAIFSLSKTAPTMPDGYTHKRRIMTVLTDAASHIRGFIQDGDRVTFKQPINDLAYAALASANRTAYVVTAPPNMQAIIRATMLWNGTVNDVFTWFDSESRPDVQASITNFDLYVHNQYGTGNIIKNIKTDASKQIFGRGGSTSIYIDLTTLGWIDDRGTAAA
jgi:hypothetical protein